MSVLIRSFSRNARKTNGWREANNFSRTSDFGGPPETKAALEPVHFAIAYDADGKIRGYRNGKAYGTPYQSKGPAKFKAKQSQVVLGLRHGTKIGKRRNLFGRIHQVSIYDTALSEDSIASLAAGKQVLTRKMILDQLTKSEQEKYSKIEADISKLEKQLNVLNAESGGIAENAVWTGFAHSLFNFKEFIYVY